MRNRRLKNILLLGILPVCLLIAGYVRFQKSFTDNDAGISTRVSKPAVQNRYNTREINWIGNWYKEDKREDLVREVAREFIFLNQDYKINLLFNVELFDRSSKADMANYIVKMISTNVYEWDIIWLDDIIYQIVSNQLDDPYWGKKYLIDFLEVPNFITTQKPFLINDPYYRNLTGGIIPGPYLEGYYYSIWYNEIVASELGLDIKEFDMTFDDLLGYARVVNNYNQNNPGKEIGTFYEAYDWFSMSFLFQHLYKSEINDSYLLEKNQLTPRQLEALKTVFTYLEKLAQYSPLINSHNINLWYDTRDLVLNDKALFYVNGTWMYSHWRGIDKKKMLKMKPAELPVIKKYDYYLGGYIPTFAVFKNAPHSRNAIELMMHMSTEKVGKKWIKYAKNPTGIAINSKEKPFSSDNYEAFIHKLFDKYQGRVRYSPNADYVFGKEHANLNKSLEENIRLILSQQISAIEAYDNLVNQLSLQAYILEN